MIYTNCLTEMYIVVIVAVQQIQIKYYRYMHTKMNNIDKLYSDAWHVKIYTIYYYKILNCRVDIGNCRQ